MLTSLGLIFLSGLLLSRLCRRIRLPHIVGLLLAGMILGPCCLGLLAGQILAVSSELRRTSADRNSCIFHIHGLLEGQCRAAPGRHRR